MHRAICTSVLLIRLSSWSESEFLDYTHLYSAWQLLIKSELVDSFKAAQNAHISGQSFSNGLQFHILSWDP